MVQQCRKSITALAFLLFSGFVTAQSDKAPLALKPDAPERYIVVPGDTLWGIAQRYTDSPWRWPELWNMNREQLRNPHLIYPGDVLVLDRASGRLSLAARDAGGSGDVRLSPRIRSEPIATQIPSIPPGLIEPFLSRPLVVEPDGLDNAPAIVGTEINKVILAPGNTAYVRGIGGNNPEEAWNVYRKGGPLIDPETKQTLGYEAVYLGTARLTRPGDPATVRITSSVMEMSAGDRLIAAGQAQAVNYAPHAPSKDIRGRIMTIFGSIGQVGEAGRYSVVTINRGRADGLEVGNVLAIYTRMGAVQDVTKTGRDRDKLIELPEERSGLVFVFRVFDRVSYALVTDAARPVSPLDGVRTP
ncbi:MAG: LysM peptidoglycan-binding domain-containing protein [Betaproteobacteria bacterium]|nr:LysM peptidoglycan-binding domain-containing protein [Betaproteobacteria bacterium]